MSQVKAWVATLTPQLPEWFTSRLPEWHLPNLREWHLPNIQEWHLPSLQEWHLPNLQEWRLPNLQDWHLPNLQEWHLPNLQDWHLPNLQEWHLPNWREWHLPNLQEWHLPNVQEWNLPRPSLPEWTATWLRMPNWLSISEWNIPRLSMPEWNMPSFSEWNIPRPRMPDWSILRPWEWGIPQINMSEWDLSHLPGWGYPLVPAWIYPSYWRQRTQDLVLWVWLAFITFLATREDAQKQRRQLQQEEEEEEQVVTMQEDEEEEDIDAVDVRCRKFRTEVVEEEEEEEDEGGGWRGELGEQGGLSRYPAFENLLAQSPTTGPLPPAHRHPPLTAVAEVVNKQELVIQESSELESGTLADEELPGAEAETDSQEKEVIWKSLLAKYAAEEPSRESIISVEDEPPEFVGTADEIVERYASKFEPDESVKKSEENQRNISAEEFNARVGKRLEEYLARMEEDEEDAATHTDLKKDQMKEVKDDEAQGVQDTKTIEEAKDTEIEEDHDVKEEFLDARDIEEEVEELPQVMDTEGDDKNRIFILIEDEESEEDRRQIDVSDASELDHSELPEMGPEPSEHQEDADKSQPLEMMETKEEGLQAEGEVQVTVDERGEEQEVVNEKETMKQVESSSMDAEPITSGDDAMIVERVEPQEQSAKPQEFTEPQEQSAELQEVSAEPQEKSVEPQEEQSAEPQEQSAESTRETTVDGQQQPTDEDGRHEDVAKESRAPQEAPADAAGEQAGVEKPQKKEGRKRRLVIKFSSFIMQDEEPGPGENQVEEDKVETLMMTQRQQPPVTEVAEDGQSEEKHSVKVTSEEQEPPSEVLSEGEPGIQTSEAVKQAEDQKETLENEATAELVKEAKGQEDEKVDEPSEAKKKAEAVEVSEMVKNMSGGEPTVVTTVEESEVEQAIVPAPQALHTRILQTREDEKEVASGEVRPDADQKKQLPIDTASNRTADVMIDTADGMRAEAVNVEPEVEDFWRQEPDSRQPSDVGGGEPSKPRVFDDDSAIDFWADWDRDEDVVGTRTVTGKTTEEPIAGVVENVLTAREMEATVAEKHQRDNEAQGTDENMEEEVSSRVGDWTAQDEIWGSGKTVGATASLAAETDQEPLLAASTADMMEEDNEDAMEVDVEDVGDNMDADIQMSDAEDMHDLVEEHVVPKEEVVDDYLAEVQDLLVKPPRRKNRRRLQPVVAEPEETPEASGMTEEAAVNPYLAKYMAAPASLTTVEEEELRKYMAESDNAKELDMEKFMALPATLTEQEQQELDEVVKEQERVRESERRGLERFLNMPPGLTEQELRELQQLEKEVEQPSRKREDDFEHYLSMPHALTEEEEKLLREGQEEDVEFENEEEYREYIRNKFLRQLEEEAYRMVEEDDDYDYDDYEDDYEYEDEYEDEDEGEMEGEYVMVTDDVPDIGAVGAVAPAVPASPAGAAAGAVRLVDEAVNTEAEVSDSDKKSKKLFSFSKRSEKETTPEETATQSKKFFHFGGLGARKKKDTSDPPGDKKFDYMSHKRFGGGAGGSLSAAFFTVRDKIEGQVGKGLPLEVGSQVRKRQPLGGPKGIQNKVQVKKDTGSHTPPADDMEIMTSKPRRPVRTKRMTSSTMSGDVPVIGRDTQGSGSIEVVDLKKKTKEDRRKNMVQILHPIEEEDGVNVALGKGTGVYLTDVPAAHDIPIVIEEGDEDVDDEIAKVFIEDQRPSGGQELRPEGTAALKGSGSPLDDEEGFWRQWTTEETAIISGARDSASPWQLNEQEEEEQSPRGQNEVEASGGRGQYRGSEVKESQVEHVENPPASRGARDPRCTGTRTMAGGEGGGGVSSPRPVHVHSPSHNAAHTDTEHRAKSGARTEDGAAGQSDIYPVPRDISFVCERGLRGSGEGQSQAEGGTTQEGVQTHTASPALPSGDTATTHRKGCAMSDVETTDTAMDLHRLDDEDDDFWRNRGDDDDDDDVPYRSYLAKNEEEELGEEAVESTVTARNEDGYAAAEEEEGPQGSNHVGGVNEEDVVPPEGDECLETDGKAAQNGVRATTTEKKKKKKKSEDGEKKSKKKKKKRKGDAEKENKKAAYQYRDDLLQKHVGPRVRSFDASKMKSKFEKPKQVTQVPSECRQCGKQVFQMEKIVAEKASWHKNCFRCKECNTILTLETYQSHEGVLYCKPHFKDLFRPKAVIEDPDEARRERLMRRPKMIVLESKPEALPDDVVRSTDKPDYGLEELSNTNLKQKFAMFELISAEEEQSQEPIPVRRSQSLLSKAARFMQSEDDSYGVENSELGEYEEDDEEEDEEEEEEEDDEEDADKVKKKGRPTSFSGMQDLKAGWAQKKRRDEMTRKRREELAKFRQMLCAGKNITTREMFESGNFEDLEKRQKRKEPINIEGRPAAKNLRERFEKGLSLQEDEEDRDDEPREVDHVFREAETASKARSLFKQIDSAVQEGNEPVLRVRSSAQARRENRLSRDGKRIRNITSQVYNEQSKDSDEDDDEDEDEDEDEDIPIETSTLIDRFKFFATYEERAKQEEQKRRKVFRITPPRDGADKGIDVAEQELGRDPNLIRCTDNYQDEVDCRSTRNVLAMFRKMEMQTEEDDRGPRPLKRFTPPPEGEDDESDEDEYSDEEEYSDEDEEDESEDDDEEDDEYERKPKYKDEVLEMSAKKAASLRAKFEKWESEVERNNEYNRSDRPEDEEECMPSIDTARNLRAMFENKAQEASRPVTERPKIKVNRFV